MNFKNKLKTIFLDPNTTNIQLTDEKINVILSPSLYWVKKLPLPVKYERDARKLLPSLFEETIPEGNYNYKVYKSGDEFVIFAYEDKLILDTFTKHGISQSNIANVYFAQSELEDVEGAVKVNEDQSIYVKDGIVILVPCCWIEESGKLNLSEIKHSKHTISLQQYSHIVDKASLYKMGGVMLLLCVLVFSELFITTQKTSNIDELKDQLFEKYQLKSTMMQNRSMLKKYNSIHKTQTNLREDISNILSLRLSGEEKISYIAYKNKKLMLEIENATKTTESNILKQLKAKKIKPKTSLKDKTLHMEISL